MIMLKRDLFEFISSWRYKSWINALRFEVAISFSLHEWRRSRHIWLFCFNLQFWSWSNCFFDVFFISNSKTQVMKSTLWDSKLQSRFFFTNDNDRDTFDQSFALVHKLSRYSHDSTSLHIRHFEFRSTSDEINALKFEAAIFFSFHEWSRSRYNWIAARFEIFIFTFKLLETCLLLLCLYSHRVSILRMYSREMKHTSEFMLKSLFVDSKCRF